MEHNQVITILEMDEPEEILRYYDDINLVPWGFPEAGRMAVGKILCNEYQCMKCIEDGTVKALVIYQNQAERIFVIKIVPIGDKFIVRKFKDKVIDHFRSLEAKEIHAASMHQNEKAIARLFGLEYQYSMFKRRI